MTTYSGSCHCGKVRYQVTLDLESGEGELTSYKFNKKVIDHLFCSTCGVPSFARGVGKDGQPMVAVNARCLDGVDLAALEVMHFDGASR